MSEEESLPLALVRGLRRWFRDVAARRGLMGALRRLLSAAGYFWRESTPARRRARYGDIDFDWDYRVDTTSATVAWRSSLRGALGGSLYQPSEPALFHQSMASLPIDFSQYTFLDLGSGKGRALLMVSDYPFRRIVGVELLPELHRIAQQKYGNTRATGSDATHLNSTVWTPRSTSFRPSPCSSTSSTRCMRRDSKGSSIGWSARWQNIRGRRLSSTTIPCWSRWSPGATGCSVSAARTNMPFTKTGDAFDIASPMPLPV